MGGVLSPGPYEHNPLVGNRPMKYPYTTAAQIAQYPVVFLWRYTPMFKTFTLAFIPNMFIMYKLQKWSYAPSNVEEWKQRRKEWYTRHLPPEWDCY